MATKAEETRARDLLEEYLGETAPRFSEQLKEVMYQAILFVVVEEGLAD